MVNRRAGFRIGVAVGYRCPCYYAPETPAAVERTTPELSVVFVRVQWEQGTDGEAAGCVCEFTGGGGDDLPLLPLLPQS